MCERERERERERMIKEMVGAEEWREEFKKREREKTVAFNAW